MEALQTQATSDRGGGGGTAVALSKQETTKQHANKSGNL
jgi:hypothetical protein